MKRNSVVIPFAALLAVIGIPPAIFASPVYMVPPGLQTGDQYRIIFVTSTTTTATSGDVSYYDSVVSDAVNAPGSLLQSLGATWQAIVSTNAVSAEQHIGTFSVPVFLVNGLKVASGSQDLWSGQATVLGADITIDERGNATQSPFTWTGTGPDGSQADPLGGVAATVGCTIINTSAWIDVPNADQISSHALPLYGISSILTVPEPGNAGLVVIAMLLLIGAKRFLAASAGRAG